MQRNATSVIVSGLAVLAFTACSSAPKQEPTKYMGQEIEAVSSADNSRPKWTYDSGWSIEDVRQQHGDDPMDPKFAYVVTSASVMSL